MKFSRAGNIFIVQEWENHTGLLLRVELLCLRSEMLEDYWRSLVW